MNTFSVQPNSYINLTTLQYHILFLPCIKYAKTNCKVYIFFLFYTRNTLTRNTSQFLSEESYIRHICIGFLTLKAKITSCFFLHRISFKNFGRDKIVSHAHTEHNEMTLRSLLIFCDFSLLKCI